MHGERSARPTTPARVSTGSLALPPALRSITVFSHAQNVVFCTGCSTVLCQPTGGKARLTEGCSFRKKVE